MLLPTHFTPECRHLFLLRLFSIDPHRHIATSLHRHIATSPHRHIATSPPDSYLQLRPTALITIQRIVDHLVQARTDALGKELAIVDAGKDPIG